MELHVHGVANPAPFLSARDLFETEFDLELPVRVELDVDPDARTWAAHYDTHHVLNVSQRVASSAMARELALHELSHMRRYEEGHASHRQSTREALYLALAEPNPPRHLAYHGLQIANHMRDIYADDLTLSLAPADKLVAFLESSLAAAVRDGHPEAPERASITAVNAAFALGLCERHDLVDDDHRLHDLAHAAGADAPAVPLTRFKRTFATLPPTPTGSEFRRGLVETIRAYADGASGA
ncbi:MAG: DUF5781 family protein [Halobacteriales archaeon]